MKIMKKLFVLQVWIYEGESKPNFGSLIPALRLYSALVTWLTVPSGVCCARIYMSPSLIIFMVRFIDQGNNLN